MASGYDNTILADSPSFPRKVLEDDHFDIPVDIENQLVKEKELGTKSSTNISFFEDHLRGMRVGYPSDWAPLVFNNTDTERASQLVRPVQDANKHLERVFEIRGPEIENGGTPAKLAIFFQNLTSNNIALNEYVADNRLFLQDFANIESDYSIKIGDGAGHVFGFSYNNSKAMVVSTIIGNRAYILLYTALTPDLYSKYLNGINTVISSFEALNVIDILKVSYYSNGRTFYSTYWLGAPFNQDDFFPIKENTNRIFRSVNEPQLPTLEGNTITITFGMFIDTDLNENPDYLVSVHRKTNGNWSYAFTEYEPVISSINEIFETKTYYINEQNGFSSVNGKSYFNLAADLGLLGAPSRYKVLFFSSETTEYTNGTRNTINDFTNWVSVPPPTIAISTVPKSIDVKQGENKTISLLVNSTSGYSPVVSLIANPKDGIDVKFANNTLTIPSYGTSRVNLAVHVNESASTGPSAIPIFANIALPPEFIAGAQRNDPSFKDKFNISSTVTGQDITTQSLLSITKIEKDPFYQPVLDSMNKFAVPLSFVSGIITGGLGKWIVGILRKKLQRRSA